MTESDKSRRKKVLISMDPEVLAWVDAHAERMGMNRSQVIETCCRGEMADMKLIDRVLQSPKVFNAIVAGLRKVQGSSPNRWDEDVEGTERERES